MTPEQKIMLAEKIQTGLLFVWGFTLLLFPVIYTTYTTDAFILPKMFFIAAVVLVSLLAWGVLMLLHGQVRIKRTPLDVPILLFVVAVILSSIFSANRADSLTQAAIVVFATLAYFVLVNVFQTRKVAMFFLSSLLTGGILATLVTVAARYKIYVLPFASAKAVGFTPLGTSMEYVLVMAMLLPLAFSFVMPALKRQFTSRVGVFALAGLVLLAGIVVVGMGLLTNQKPTILPFDTGFQTAFAAISQDSGRILQTFLFGEGYGTFATVFARFHNASLNANQQLWFLSFNNSSSYLLELLATTGLVGTLSFLFLAYRTLTPIALKKKNPFYLSLVVAFVLSAVIPFSTIELVVLFFLLAGMTLAHREARSAEYFDIELKFVALKKGVVTFTTLDIAEQGRTDRHPTPIAAFVVLLALVVSLGYYSITYAASDFLFQQSLTAANANNGTLTYRLQTQAINIYPYRSDYYRIFSQTNIALANSLLSLNSGHASPSATTQQTAYSLIQQSITTARQATILSPLSAASWQNLASIYRALIGVGQNADSFAIAASQQAITLDPVNPQEYLNLGGMYYQLGQYDNAIRMFQQAIALKSDYANAYYNLAHAYEQKNDTQNALAQLQIVKQLVVNNAQNEAQVTKEIDALQSHQTAQANPALGAPTSTQLPAQPTQVPLVTPTPTPGK